MIGELKYQKETFSITEFYGLLHGKKFEDHIVKIILDENIDPIIFLKDINGVNKEILIELFRTLEEKLEFIENYAEYLTIEDFIKVSPSRKIYYKSKDFVCREIHYFRYSIKMLELEPSRIQQFVIKYSKNVSFSSDGSDIQNFYFTHESKVLLFSNEGRRNIPMFGVAKFIELFGPYLPVDALNHPFFRKHAQNQRSKIVASDKIARLIKAAEPAAAASDHYTESFTITIKAQCS